MFTTGSKLFIGATMVALIATVVFAVTTGGDTGWTATIGLISATVALAFLTGINFFVRDSNVGGMQHEAITTSAAAQVAPGASMWPVITAFGAGLVVVGLIATPVVFKAGIVVLLASMLEWTVQSWSERASSDRAYNAAIRKRLLHPLEFPVLSAVGLAVIIYSFSRIMLFLSKETGPAVFGILAALIVVAGFLFASKASVKKSVVAGVCTIAALGLVSTGAVMAIDGERSMHEHETIGADTGAICLANDETKADEKSSQSLGAKSNVAATVVFSNDDLYAQVIGLSELQRTITLSSSNPSNIVFRNLSDQTVRLTASLGAFETDTIVNGAPTVERPITCTALVEPDGRQFLTLKIPQSSRATLEPYTLFVPGVEGASIEVVVP